MADAIASQLEDSEKPVIAFVSPHAPEAASVLTQYGIPSYVQPENCAAALDGMRRATMRGPIEEGTTRSTGTVDVSDLPSGSLNEAEAKTLFSRFGISCVRGRIVDTHEEAIDAAQQFGPRVALKVLSSEITHKSDAGGVALNVTESDIASRMEAMRREFESKSGIAPKQFLVQEMIAGVELILGLRHDHLGTAILLGSGGVTAELINDMVLRMLPERGSLSQEQATEMIRALKCFPLLDGYRGRPKADVPALADAICAFSQMAALLGARLSEAEINPLFVLPAGTGVRAADGVAVLGKSGET